MNAAANPVKGIRKRIRCLIAGLRPVGPHEDSVAAGRFVTGTPDPLFADRMLSEPLNGGQTGVVKSRRNRV